MNDLSKASLAATAKGTAKIIASGFALGCTKLLQAMDNITAERIEQYVTDANVVLEETMHDILNNCSIKKDMTNISEAVLVEKLICKIIANGKVNRKYLSDETCSKLCAILNNYSNKKYIGLPLSVYQKEKTAASKAVVNGVIGTTVANIATDVTEELITSGNNQVCKNIKSVLDTQKPTNITQNVTETLATGAIGLGFSLVLAGVGIELFKKYNTSIPKQYIPDLNKLITAIVHKQNDITRLHNNFTACYDNEVRKIVDKAERLFREAGINAKQHANIEFAFVDRTSVTVRRADFDFTNRKLKSDTNNKFTARINLKCKKSAYDDEVEEKKREIESINDILKKYTAIFKITTKDEIVELSKDFAQYFENITVENINNETINSIAAKIELIKEEINEARRREQQVTENEMKKSIADATADVVADFAVKVGEKGFNLANRVAESFSSTMNKRSRGGKQSKLLTRKKQKIRKQRIQYTK
uniref:Uncharacterized protein n=1 Tax=viral metagenome TaxID=1070528 RepID=A0A6C0D5A7_9ZZZZ